MERLMSLAFMGAMCINTLAQVSSSFVFSGRVKDAKGNGVANVVVNNGIRFVKTNANGDWSLPTDTNCCKFVSISTDRKSVV